MRSDMAKVIVERPRLGGGFRYPRAASQPFGRGPAEEWPRRQSIRRPWTDRQKSLNENLSPLRRFLRSNVNRPWDKVYAEICERINRDSAVQLHIWQHLQDFVCTDPHLISGDVTGSGWGHRAFRWCQFYVDPRTRLLRENEDYWRRYQRTAPEPPRDVVPVDRTRCYRQLDGIWYEVTLRPLPEDPTTSVFDMAEKRRVYSADRREWHHRYGAALYAAAKRQLNTREIRRLPGVTD